MSSPIISVIVPVYNTEKWLRRCVDSILAQTFTDFELLLIDDGSTDGSGAICDEYAGIDSRVRVFHKPNGGVSSARNLGLNNARGEWISFVDADDWIYLTTLETLFKASDKNEIVFLSISEIFEDGTRVDYIAKDVQSDDKEITQRNILYLKNNEANYPFFGYTVSKMFRRDIIEEFHIRFINGFACFEDEIFTDEYCRNITRLRIVSKPLYCYRRSTCGLTGRRRTTKDLLTLSQKLLFFSDCYSDEQLKAYELNRSIEFLKEAIDKDVCVEFYNNEKALLRLIEKKSKRQFNGIKLKIIRSLNKCLGSVLLKICQRIKIRRI